MVTIQENINRIFEDDAFLRIFNKTLKDNQMNSMKNKWNFNEYDNNVNIQHLDVPIKDQKAGYSYTYVEDYKTAKKIIADLSKYFRNAHINVSHKYINTNIEPDPDNYASIGNVKTYDKTDVSIDGKFLETASIQGTAESVKGEKININVGMCTIIIDAPEFDDFYQPNHFTVYLDTNILDNLQKYTHKTQILRKYTVIDVINIINKNINQNWQFIDFTGFNRNLNDEIEKIDDEEFEEQRRQRILKSKNNNKNK